MLMGEYQPQLELHRPVCGNHADGWVSASVRAAQTCLWQSCSWVSISLSQSCTDLFVAIILMAEYQPQLELHRSVCGNHAHGWVSTSVRAAQTCLWQSCWLVSISLSQSCTDLFVAIMLMGEYQPQSELHRLVCGNNADGWVSASVKAAQTCLWQSCSWVSISLSQNCTNLFVPWVSISLS